MINFKKRFLQKNLTTKKDFRYSKGSSQLNFVLSIDVESGLKDFRECLVEALKDIDELLDSK